MNKSNKRSETTLLKPTHWQPLQSQTTAPKSRRIVTNRKPWTKEEDAIIRKNYTKHGAPYTARLLSRNITSVQHRARRLEVPGKGVRAWTQIEETYLKKHYPGRTASEIARTLRRTEMSVRNHIHQLQLGGPKAEEWTDDEVAFLRKHYRTARIAELATELGRTPAAVELKASRMGYTRKKVELDDSQVTWVKKNLGRISYDNMAQKLGVCNTTIMKIAHDNGYRPKPNMRPWTEKDDDHLRRYYGVKTRRQIATTLGRTVDAVGMRAGLLGLTNDRRNKSQARRWTPQEDVALRKLYGRMTIARIAERLERTPASISGRVQQLGIRKRSKSKENGST